MGILFWLTGEIWNRDFHLLSLICHIFLQFIEHERIWGYTVQRAFETATVPRHKSCNNMINPACLLSKQDAGVCWCWQCLNLCFFPNLQIVAPQYQGLTHFMFQNGTKHWGDKLALEHHLLHQWYTLWSRMNKMSEAVSSWLDYRA